VERRHLWRGQFGRVEGVNLVGRMCCDIFGT
jgi:hypothetical protein